MSKSQWRLEESIAPTRQIRRRRAVSLRSFFGQYDPTDGGGGSSAPSYPGGGSIFIPTPHYPTPLTPINPLTPFSPGRPSYQPPVNPPANTFVPPPGVYVPPPSPVSTFVPPPSTPVLRPPTPVPPPPSPVASLLQNTITSVPVNAPSTPSWGVATSGAHDNPNPYVAPPAPTPAPITPVTPTITVTAPVPTVSPVVQLLNQNLPPSRAAISAPVIYTQAQPFVSPSAPTPVAPVSSGHWETRQQTTWDDSYDSAVPSIKYVRVWVPNAPSAYVPPAPVYTPPPTPVFPPPAQVYTPENVHPAMALAQIKNNARSLDPVNVYAPPAPTSFVPPTPALYAPSPSVQPVSSGFMRSVCDITSGHNPTDYASGAKFRDELFSYFFTNRNNLPSHGNHPMPRINGKPMDVVLKENLIGDGSSDNSLNNKEELTQDFKKLWDYFNGMCGLIRGGDAFARQVNLTKGALKQAYADVMSAGAVSQTTAQAVLANAQQTGASAPELVSGPVTNALSYINRNLNLLVLATRSKTGTEVAVKYAIISLGNKVKSFFPPKAPSPYDFIVPTSSGQVPTLDVLAAMKQSGEQAASDYSFTPFHPVSFQPAPLVVAPYFAPARERSLVTPAPHLPLLKAGTRVSAAPSSAAATDALSFTRAEGALAALSLSGRPMYTSSPDQPLVDSTYVPAPSTYAAVTGGNAIDALASVKVAAQSQKTGTLNDSNFNATIRGTKGIVVVKFQSRTCGVCRTNEPFFTAAAAEVPDASFYHVDVDDSPNTASANNVSTLPNYMIFKDGQLARGMDGQTSDFVGAVHPGWIKGWVDSVKRASGQSAPVLQSPPAAPVQTFTQVAPVIKAPVRNVTGATKLDDSNFWPTINASRGCVVVKFGATWCGPCRAAAPSLNKAAVNMPNIAVYDVDVDESPNAQSHFRSRGIPAFVIFKDGVPLTNQMHTGWDSDMSWRDIQGWVQAACQ